MDFQLLLTMASDGLWEFPKPPVFMVPIVDMKSLVIATAATGQKSWDL